MLNDVHGLEAFLLHGVGGIFLSLYLSGVGYSTVHTLAWTIGIANGDFCTLVLYVVLQMIVSMFMYPYS